MTEEKVARFCPHCGARVKAAAKVFEKPATCPKCKKKDMFHLQHPPGETPSPADDNNEAAAPRRARSRHAPGKSVLGIVALAVCGLALLVALVPGIGFLFAWFFATAAFGLGIAGLVVALNKKTSGPTLPIVGIAASCLAAVAAPFLTDMTTAATMGAMSKHMHAEFQRASEELAREMEEELGDQADVRPAEANTAEHATSVDDITVVHKSGPITLKESSAFDDDVFKVELGEISKCTAKMYIDDFFDKRIINANIKVGNPTKKPLWVTYHVAFLDEDDNVVGAISQGSDVDPEGETHYGSCLIELPHEMFRKVTAYKIALYESHNDIN